MINNNDDLFSNPTSHRAVANSGETIAGSFGKHDVLYNKQYYYPKAGPLSDPSGEAVGDPFGKPKVPYNKQYFYPTDPTLLAPFDVLWLTVNEPVDVSWIEPCLVDEQRRKHKSKRCFSSQSSGTYRLPNGADVRIYQNVVSTQIQIIPYEWSYNGLIGFLEKLLKKNFKEAYVTKIHQHVDIPFTLEVILKSALVRRRRTSTSYDAMNAKTMKRTAGRIREVKFSRSFGSEKSRSIAFYDSARKHGFNAPMTRIEIRDNHPNCASVRHPLDIPSLLETSIMSDEVRLADVTPLPNLSVKHQERWMLFERLVNELGYHDAVSEMRSMDRNFPALLTQISQVKPLPVDLDHEFRQRLLLFICMPTTAKELEIINSDDLSKVKHQFVLNGGARPVNTDSQWRLNYDSQLRYFKQIVFYLDELKSLLIEAEYLARTDGFGNDFDLTQLDPVESLKKQVIAYGIQRGWLGEVNGQVLQ
ncbi:MAG: hypothetical protein P4M08_01320 [Oligoflexia bacterium]|nr:hypothetical protein [Oligoflexia bacterium]